ncbi:MAG: protein kinase [Dehalococcoidia bacterium]
MAKAPTPTHDSASEQLVAGRYHLEEQVGSGGMSVVYCADDTLLGRKVAVKKLADWLEHDEAHAVKFVDEARVAARLSHPGIVTVHDTVSDDSGHYIVMEYVEGQDLDELAAGQQQAIDIVVQVADALEYAHSMGIIHCDVKPGNILVDPAGRPHLLDFGIARAATQTWALATTVLGTAAYMAPEVVEGQRPTALSDVYSLGVVLYEKLAGRLPFDGASVAALTAQRLVQDPIELRKVWPEADKKLEAIVMKALARNPAQRTASASDLAEELRGLAAPSAANIERPTLAEAQVARPEPTSGRPAPVAAPRGAPVATPRAERQPLPAWVVRMAILVAVLAGCWLLSYVLLSL